MTTRTRKTDKPENQVMKEVALAWSENFAPGILWRQNAGQGLSLTGTRIPLGPKGIADFVGFIDGGWIVFVEVKKRTGKLRESQKRWRDLVEKAGCIFVVARSDQDLITGVQAACDARGITLPGQPIRSPAA